MKLIKWIDRPTILMDEVNHWLDSLSVDTPINFYNKSTSWVPQFEVREIDDSYQIFAELPGMNKKDVNIEVIDGNLTISGEKSNSDADKKHYSEISYGKFNRNFNLPEDVIKGAALVSGIYDLEIVKKISVNNDIKLTDNDAIKLSTINKIPLLKLPLIIAYGEKEPDGWKKQSLIYIILLYK